MEIKMEKKDEMEFVLENEDHTIAQLLLSYLHKDPNVEKATYVIEPVSYTHLTLPTTERV